MCTGSEGTARYVKQGVQGVVADGTSSVGTPAAEEKRSSAEAGGAEGSSAACSSPSAASRRRCEEAEVPTPLRRLASRAALPEASGYHHAVKKPSSAAPDRGALILREPPHGSAQGERPCDGAAGASSAAEEEAAEEFEESECDTEEEEEECEDKYEDEDDEEASDCEHAWTSRARSRLLHAAAMLNSSDEEQRTFAEALMRHCEGAGKDLGPYGLQRRRAEPSRAPRGSEAHVIISVRSLAGEVVFGPEATAATEAISHLSWRVAQKLGGRPVGSTHLLHESKKLDPAASLASAGVTNESVLTLVHSTSSGLSVAHEIPWAYDNHDLRTHHLLSAAAANGGAVPRFYPVGPYIVKDPVIVGDSPWMNSVDLAELPRGTQVDVVEVVRVSKDDRVRALIAKPVEGWISLVKLSDFSSRWAVSSEAP